MKLAIIWLFSKTTPEETNIAKWRPISLLCVDYKIITKTITNRLLPTLNEIISLEQSAAVPGRHIYDNLFTIRDLINYSNKKHIPTYILSFDQEKAFDKVDRNYMFRCLERMNYPKQFVDFIKKCTPKYKIMDACPKNYFRKGESGKPALSLSHSTASKMASFHTIFEKI